MPWKSGVAARVGVTISVASIIAKGEILAIFEILPNGGGDQPLRQAVIGGEDPGRSTPPRTITPTTTLIVVNELLVHSA
jgi:hypothetical protein